MAESFIVNGIEMSLGAKSTQLVYQSPLFTELDSIVSNRTNSVDFPITPNNLRAVGFSHLVQSGSENLYRKYDSIYLRDGVQVFKGIGYVLKITPSAIQMTFVWGNVNAFAPLMQRKLQDLQTQDEYDYVEWNELTVQYDQRFYKELDCGQAGKCLPYLPVNEIVDRIAAANGITILRGNYFKDLVIPLVTRYLDARSNEANALHITTGDVYFLKEMGESGNRNDYGINALLCPAVTDPDVQMQYLGDGVYDVSEADKVRLVVKAGFTIHNIYHNDNYWLCVCACDQDGQHGKSLMPLGISSKWKVTAANSSVTSVLQEDVDITLDVSNYQYIYLRMGQNISSKDYFTFGGVDVRLINSGNENDGECVWNGILPLWRNLPDWTQGQFLKNIMKMKGLFAYAENETTINFVHASYLYTMRSQGYDWSDKVQLTKGQATELSPTFGSYAQRNLCKYAEDEDITKNYDGALVVDNDTLDDESDCIQLDFGACQNNKIPYWVYDADNETYEFESGLNPRVMRYTGDQNETAQNIISFDGLEWNNLIQTYYAEIQDIIYRPESVKVTLRYTIEDLMRLDLRKPVYIKQFGSYFAIMKITTKDKGLADAELLRLV